jgi:hypothetical protein
VCVWREEKSLKTAKNCIEKEVFLPFLLNFLYFCRRLRGRHDQESFVAIWKYSRHEQSVGGLLWRLEGDEKEGSGFGKVWRTHSAATRPVCGQS